MRSGVERPAWSTRRDRTGPVRTGCDKASVGASRRTGVTERGWRSFEQARRGEARRRASLRIVDVRCVGLCGLVVSASLGRGKVRHATTRCGLTCRCAMRQLSGRRHVVKCKRVRARLGLSRERRGLGVREQVDMTRGGKASLSATQRGLICDRPSV